MGTQMAYPHMRRAVLAAAVLSSAVGFAQENPYRTVENWAQMPPGRAWGSTSAVDIDRDGTAVWPSLISEKGKKP